MIQKIILGTVTLFLLTACISEHQYISEQSIQDSITYETKPIFDLSLDCYEHKRYNDAYFLLNPDFSINLSDYLNGTKSYFNKNIAHMDLPADYIMAELDKDIFSPSTLNYYNETFICEIQGDVIIEYKIEGEAYAYIHQCNNFQRSLEKTYIFCSENGSCEFKYPPKKSNYYSPFHFIDSPNYFIIKECYGDQNFQ